MEREGKEGKKEPLKRIDRVTRNREQERREGRGKSDMKTLEERVGIGGKRVRGENR